MKMQNYKLFPIYTNFLLRVRAECPPATLPEWIAAKSQCTGNQTFVKSAKFGSNQLEISTE